MVFQSTSDAQLEEKIHGLERLMGWLAEHGGRYELLSRLIRDLRSELARRHRFATPAADTGSL
jgi:hypothetical protein